MGRIMLSKQNNLIEKVPRAGLLSMNLPGHFSLAHLRQPMALKATSLSLAVFFLF